MSKNQIVSIVVATGENNEIGKNNSLLWHLPADLKHFKNTTSGNTVIMGRKTFESIGKPLPNRRNIVVTSQPDLKIEGIETASTIQIALDSCREDNEIYVIGGGSIYRQVLAQTDKIYLTIVHQIFDADIFFPFINKNEWKEESRVFNKADEKNKFDYSFIELNRI